jgi:multiple sugar transport system permease protein
MLLTPVRNQLLEAKRELLEKKLTPLTLAIMCLALVLVVFPVFWIVMTSIKPPTDWNASPAIWVPSEPTLINFKTLFDPTALREYGVGGVSQSATRSGFRLASGLGHATALSVAIGLFLGHRHLPLRHPEQGHAAYHPLRPHVPPGGHRRALRDHLFQCGPDGQLRGTHRHLCGGHPAVFHLDAQSFVDDLPREIEEAAMLDGKSRLLAHLTVTIPLIKGGLFATTMFILILNWSEFMFALVLSYSNVSTIPVQLAKYVTATAGTCTGSRPPWPSWPWPRWWSSAT